MFSSFKKKIPETPRRACQCRNGNLERCSWVYQRELGCNNLCSFNSTYCTQGKQRTLPGHGCPSDTRLAAMEKCNFTPTQPHAHGHCAECWGQKRRLSQGQTVAPGRWTEPEPVLTRLKGKPVLALTEWLAVSLPEESNSLLQTPATLGQQPGRNLPLLQPECHQAWQQSLTVCPNSMQGHKKYGENVNLDPKGQENLQEPRPRCKAAPEGRSALQRS